ncbi:sugar phosphate isomerase/epimerase family protein [Imperialibacter roseus]|uniref:Sugar phosphate isomerase/epimerase family protein n=1 Tax=Imperialibacter roseus TaxID=1324217 RepID=A0ABZ0IY98_9BACT|nr:sugar phosphate isomerase/epimerase family protein [Imperialibacter roseus]WOK09369.1 sugar phosphate isomerase/epimerase family protein [Imperialibacter roseus]
MHRRKFIQASAMAAAVAASPSFPLFSGTKAQRKFKLALNPGIIGVKANFAQTLDYAIQYGYEAISPFTQEVMKDYSSAQLNEIMAKMKANKITYDSTNIPVEFRRDEAKFKEDVKELPKFCEAMQKQGATRINTWIISSHPTLTYNENMRQHAARLGECAKIMNEYGIRLGLEYLGMRTLVAGNRYTFISSMKEGKELIAAIGTGNVGFVLDSFHWYCANDTLEDIKTLTPSDIITADINDARAGFKREEQQDGKRELPLATGVINMKDFLQGLIDIGYDGPVRTEPFNQALNELENDEALATNMTAMKKALALVGM